MTTGDPGTVATATAATVVGGIKLPVVGGIKPPVVAGHRSVIDQRSAKIFALHGIEPWTFSVPLHTKPCQVDYGHVKETRYHCATAQKLSALKQA